MFTIINIITTTNIIIKSVIFCCKIPSIGCEIIILTTVLSLVLISGFYFDLEIETVELLILNEITLVFFNKK